MGASNFSGTYASNPDYFDGDASETRDTRTNAKPDLYELLLELATQYATFQKTAADGSAGAATAEIPFYFMESYIKSVQEVWFVPAAGLTGDPSNNATLSVYKRNPTGGGQVLVASLTTTANWTAFEPVAIPLAVALGNAALDVPAGWSLTFAITKNSSGVAVPAGQLVVEYL